jgi:hypothetical protein
MNLSMTMLRDEHSFLLNTNSPRSHPILSNMFHDISVYFNFDLVMCFVQINPNYRARFHVLSASFNIRLKW